MPDEPFEDPEAGLELISGGAGDTDDVSPEPLEPDPREPDQQEAEPDVQPVIETPVQFTPVEELVQGDEELDSEFVLRAARHQTDLAIKTSDMVDAMVRDARKACPDLPDDVLDQFREEWRKTEYNALGVSRQNRAHIIIAKGALADLRDSGKLKPQVRRDVESRTPVNNAPQKAIKPASVVAGERRMALALGLDPEEFVKGGA
jgi:hypothetical protein